MMDSEQRTQRKFTILPCAIIQIISAAVSALLVRYNSVYIAALFVGVAAAMLCLQILASSSYWYLLSSTLCLCLSFIIGDITAFALCLFFVPAGIILSVLIKKKTTKINAVVILNVLYAVLFVILFIALYLLAGNKFSVSAMIDHISGAINTLCANVKEALSETISEYAARYPNISASDFYAAIDDLFVIIKLIIPSLFIVFCGVVAYITASVFKLGTSVSKCEILLPDPKWEIVPSFISAIVYIVAYSVYVIASLFSRGINVTEIVCQNIMIILQPIMLLMGLKWLFTRRRPGFIIGIFVFSMIFLMQFAITVLSFIGVWDIFRRNELKKKQSGK